MSKEALEASIQHWRENLAAERPEDASDAKDDCALCGKYWESNCDGCPVSMKTGESICIGSPYIEAANCLYDWRKNPESVAARAAWRAAANTELEFLEALR
jgi:hypothetical protein